MTLDLNSNIDNQKAGFRLASLEVLNWGTFHNTTWTIEPDGKNALLTGDIGSGKSTLVDAITTLLVPSRKITYNKAAGAETRERSLKTYVRGAFKNEKIADSAKARDVYLRSGEDHYSLLIANFRNEGTSEDVALAQVLWMSAQGVSRLYLVAGEQLTARKDFSNFGNDINQLRRRLRKRESIKMHQSFQNYATDFRRRFGIRQPEALDLFYQTVSMKQVGNLTEFVRERMLGRTEIGKQIEVLVKSYDEANRAHQAVQKARHQLETLEPLEKAAKARVKSEQQLQRLEEVRTEIPRYFTHAKIADGQKGLQELLVKWEANAAERSSLDRSLADRSAALERLRGLLNNNDIYRQIAPLERDIESTENELARRRGTAKAYAAAIESLNGQLDATALSPASTVTDFARQREEFTGLLKETDYLIGELSRESAGLNVAEHRIGEELREIDAELSSLRARPTSIPRRHLALRERLLAELKLPANQLPFAGELIRVKETAAEWEGAIERVLHGLGLSMLVPERHYLALSQVVNRLHLGGKLVYLRTLPHRGREQEDPPGENLPRKVRIKGDSEHYDWLHRELNARYNFQCCESLEEFQRASRGLTRSGQVKSGRHRHDKDDRFRIDDRSRYILGWTNQDKIAALEKDRQGILSERDAHRTKLADFEQRQKRANTRRDLLLELTGRYPEFQPLNFAESALRLRELTKELEALNARSGEVAELQAEIAQVTNKVAVLNDQREQLTKLTGRLENQCLQLANEIDRGLKRLGAATLEIDINPDKLDVPVIVAACRELEVSQSEPSAELLKLLAKTPEQHRTESGLLGLFNGNDGLVAKVNQELSKFGRRIVRQMTEFRKEFPDAAREVDADLSALPDYRRIYEKLKRDKLPGFEDQFRQLLREGTIRNIVSFQNQLKKYEREITDKITRINAHLRDIDYNEGTYITITHEAVRSEDISGFKRDLLACLSGTLDGSKDVYNEKKFQQVKKLLDRFEGANETDRRWTNKVTDVRQWFEFGADERGRDDEISREFFSDSSGKSGGQKEKLAYTILASAIAFQFGLKAGKSTDRSFRFVVIDEAFGRGSDESTRYGLRLFERLSLQLLIVTPLQKINVIEDYVSTVHYVDNPGGKNSRVRNIGISEYRREREKRKV